MPVDREGGSWQTGPRVAMPIQTTSSAHPSEPQPQHHEPAICPNCEAPGDGHYCATCGQSRHHSGRSLRTLLDEIFEDVTHLDGRVPSTLRALLVRPGQLTADHLADRRARYIPPFRLYIIISLLFFALGLLDQRPAPPAPAAADTHDVLDKIARDFERDRDLGRLAAKFRAGCDAMPALGGARGRQALVDACTRAVADRGHALREALLHNLPRAMFVFLPAIALVLFAFFRHARPYYVEHLIFTLHLQSATYLAFTAFVLVTLLSVRVPATRPVTQIATLGLIVYGLWYLFTALRVVYREGRVSTATKLLGLGVTYGVLLAIAVVGTVVVSALTS
jgi:hypothetical protein